jgi:hypothetical protein
MMDRPGLKYRCRNSDGNLNAIPSDQHGASAIMGLALVQPEAVLAEYEIFCAHTRPSRNKITSATPGHCRFSFDLATGHVLTSGLASSAETDRLAGVSSELAFSFSGGSPGELGPARNSSRMPGEAAVRSGRRPRL